MLLGTLVGTFCGWTYGICAGVGARMPRETFNTSQIGGRERGSLSQQRCTNVHKFSVNVGSLGFGGRSPRDTTRGTLKS